MKSLKINSLKLYKDKLETYIPDLLETADESDIDGLMQDLHQYKICIFPSAFSYNGTNSMCRLNIHRKTGKATLTDLKRTTDINCNAVWTKTNNSNISNISEIVECLPQIEKPSVLRSANIYFATGDDRVGRLGNPIGNNGVIAWDQSGSITYSLLVALTFNQ